MLVIQISQDLLYNAVWSGMDSAQAVECRTTDSRQCFVDMFSALIACFSNNSPLQRISALAAGEQAISRDAGTATSVQATQLQWRGIESLHYTEIVSLVVADCPFESPRPKTFSVNTMGSSFLYEMRYCR